MKFKVGDKVVVTPKANPLLGGLSGIVVETQESPIANMTYYKVDLDEERVFPEHHLIAETEYRFLTEPNATAHQLLATCGIKSADSDTKVLRAKDGTLIGEFNTGGVCTGFRGGKIPTPSKPFSIEEQLGLPKGVSIHDLDMASLYRPMNIEIQPLELVCNEEQAKNIAERLAKELNGMLGVSFTKKEEKKMPTKFAFYTASWTDIDKSNGKKIPMKITYGFIGSDPDERADTSCPASEYDERIGCLIAAAKISAKKSNEAQMMYNIARNTWGTELSWAILFELANTAFNGNFEGTYKKFHNDNIRFEKKRRTCSFCGKVFDTVEEKQTHEAWHVERKKARRERYLLRKRAKEIAFEEQAQKMAKEMIGEQK